MIVLLKGNVNYDITLDPSVWIFDNRKQALEHYLKNTVGQTDSDFKVINPFQRRGSDTCQPTTSETGSYVMPLNHFLERAEPIDQAKNAQLLMIDGTALAVLPLKDLQNSVLLFSINGRQIKEDGPVHLYNKPDATPIKGIGQIVIQ